MKKFIIVGMLLLAVVIVTPSFIAERDYAPVDPHLILGQSIHFLGSTQGKAYIVIGYRDEYDSEVDKQWKDQDYVVFLYTTELGEFKTSTIHRNAVVKK
ncbi:hypothetical protein [Persicobacter psychrovividus]|uniref:DUF3221 domain-containing protein n=1 Tax=Persicobacter psychrovividus TaxID=387638 RepID=A0ABM7VD09_9BACT|nr:hypothetical protein PEPS_08450 [Persicobacter psychrovividus]